LLLYPPSGSGAHRYLQIEKRLCNTEDLAGSLAKALEIPRREVGYAGRKDRVAVTRQWFSVPLAAEERLQAWEHPGAEVVARDLHSEKLRLGELAGNRFSLRVREIDEGAAREAAGRLEDSPRRGLANRFGRQRFGRDGKNAERGARILESGRLRGHRQTARLMLSALQSAVFNRVLELRPAPIDQLDIGDVAWVHRTGETFLVTDSVEVEQLEDFRLSPTGPMFGSKMMWARGEAAEIESQAMRDLGLNDPRRLDLPRGIKLYGGRRPLRVQPTRVSAQWLDGVLEVGFDLPAGSYATVLLEQILPSGFVEGPLVS